MKTVFTSHEIAHVWAHKSAPHGKSPSAVSFNGDVIYSYQTAMARHISHKGKAAIILNRTSYSVSTAKHQSRIACAIPSEATVFRVTGQQRETELRLSGSELFAHYLKEAEDALKQAELPRIRQTTRDAHKGRAVGFLGQAKLANEFFGLRRKVDEKAIERLAASKVRAEKREREAKEDRENLARVKQRASYEAWMRGENMADYYTQFSPSLFPTAFRVEGDELVSTHGARVPLQAARVAYRFATSKRGQQWRENGEMCTAGNYRLNAINEQGIVAGCHRISWEEIERLAPVLG